MSFIEEMERTWRDHIGGDMPPSDIWISDVRRMLGSHRKKVQSLKKELRDEEKHVSYLESLLRELESRKITDADRGDVERNFSNLNMDQVIMATLQRRSQSQSDEFDRNGRAEEMGDDAEEGFERRQEGAAAAKKSQESIEHGGKVGRRSSSPLMDSSEVEDPFVTVISVNGQEEEQEARKEDVQRNGVALEDRRRKVPPVPPPKNLNRREHFETPVPPAPRMPFKSFGRVSESEVQSQKQSQDTKLKLVDDKDVMEYLEGRKLVYDSREHHKQPGVPSKSGTSSGSSTTSSSTKGDRDHDIEKHEERNTKPIPVPKKKFEGSKVPLPQEVQKPPRKTPPVLNLRPSPSPIRRGSQSKISHIVGQWERDSAKNSNGSEEWKGRRQFSRRTSSETHLSDYMDPRDAEQVHRDDIYDLPPDSPAEEKEVFQLEHVADPTPSIEAENLYDMVAKSDGEQDGDYVVLSDEGTQSTKVRGKMRVGSSSSRRDSREGCQDAKSADSATMRSQTSMISGRSNFTASSGGTTSDTEGTTDSPLPLERTPSTNYVNLDYFLRGSLNNCSESEAESSDVESVSSLRRFSSVEECQGNMTSNGRRDENSDLFPPSQSRVCGRNINEAPTIRVSDQLRLAAYREHVENFLSTERKYVHTLNFLQQYMKAMKATFSTSKPVLSLDDFNVIFYKIPDIYKIHQTFLQGLQDEASSDSYQIGRNFEYLANQLEVYGSFLQNYSRAVDTVRKCSQNNAAFANVTQDIKTKSFNDVENVRLSLEALLHTPVARIQTVLEAVKEFIRRLPDNHPDIHHLKNAEKLFQCLLTEFSKVQPLQSTEKGRRLIKNSFIVEGKKDGTRKLRHLFLFNDVLVCANYDRKEAGRQKQVSYDCEYKWHMPISEVSIVDNPEQKEWCSSSLLALKSKASNLRDDIKRKSMSNAKIKAVEKTRKKLGELEGELLLESPSLLLKIKSNVGRSYATFFLSSEYDKTQWIDAISNLKQQDVMMSVTSAPNATEIRHWILKNKNDLKMNMNMGSYLLRSSSESLLVGDLHVKVGQLLGLQRAGAFYISLEVDSYGHFFKKAKTKMICGNAQPVWNEEFIIELEGSWNLRFLLYEDHPAQGQLIRAAKTFELISFGASTAERTINLQDYTLSVGTRFTPSERTIRRIPTAKPGALFGTKVDAVCKREKRQVPFIITMCVKEVEKRGINEQGIYRVSGSVSEAALLRKAFETDSYQAEQLLKEVDINAVASILKSYLRELPEALFTDQLYPTFFEGFGVQDEEKKSAALLRTFGSLPALNQDIICYLLDHFIRISDHVEHNKMSLQNLATVFGPTLLRPAAKSSNITSSDLLAAGTADCIAQTGVLHFFLWRRSTKQLLC